MANPYGSNSAGHLDGISKDDSVNENGGNDVQLSVKGEDKLTVLSDETAASRTADDTFDVQRNDIKLPILPTAASRPNLQTTTANRAVSCTPPWRSSRMKLLAFIASLAATLISPVQAEEVTISRTLAAGSLHEDALDMVAYWTEVPDGAIEVTATFRDRATNDEPMRIVMPLQDGVDLAFGMPGYEGALYNFTRSGQEIMISVETEASTIASADYPL